MAAEAQPKPNTVKIFNTMCRSGYRNPELYQKLRDLALHSFPGLLSFRIAYVGQIGLYFNFESIAYRVRRTIGSRGGQYYVQLLFLREPDSVFRFISELDQTHSGEVEILHEIITSIRAHKAESDGS